MMLRDRFEGRLAIIRRMRLAIFETLDAEERAAFLNDLRWLGGAFCCGWSPQDPAKQYVDETLEAREAMRLPPILQVMGWLVDKAALINKYRCVFTGRQADGTSLSHPFAPADGSMIPDMWPVHQFAEMAETFARERAQSGAKPEPSATLPEREPDGVLTLERVVSERRSFLKRWLSPRPEQRIPAGEIRIYLSGGGEPDVLHIRMDNDDPPRMMKGWRVTHLPEGKRKTEKRWLEPGRALTGAFTFHGHFDATLECLRNNKKGKITGWPVNGVGDWTIKNDL